MKFLPEINQTKKNLFFFCFILFVALHSFLPENLWCTPRVKELKEEIDAIVYKYRPSGAHVGISIYSISRDKTLYALNSHKLFVVASNMKLFTTATALVYLGSDFVYETKIFSRGPLTSEGKLQGDIIIQGSGDPNISGRFYQGKITAVPTIWAKRVEEHGIKVIAGDIIADDSIFDRKFICDSWPKDQLSEWYCAPVSGLSFNDNCIDIVVKPNNGSGNLASVQIEPITSYIKIFNTCRTTSLVSEHLYSLYRKPFTNSIYIKGKIWSKSVPQKAWITIHDPALYTATVFKEILEDRNIRVLGDTRLVNSSDKNTKTELQKIAVTLSTLRQSVEVANKRSQGFYAEQILKTLGAHIKKEGSFSAGLDVIRDFLASFGFSDAEYQIHDGSGLSKKNRLTTVLVTTLLTFMYKHEYGDIFSQSLSVAGIDGTLKRRMNREPYRSRIRAKTGYVLGTCTLSGYVETLKGEIITFSILVNGIKGSIQKAKLLQDAICMFLVENN
ncbi:MAG: D-alanyl-D-alanine carboxypeptidase/D-alanyl-D-alanine-endopeptidase [Candidatus Scalindua sp.]|nr:D-alanyl-D-alanine carboxypeptidase/D-alanyl-D-alanine-endopeptidase [Candidatus Scalindua sp.]